MGATQKRDVVLLLTHSGDYFTVDRVAAALASRGARVFRFDTDRFPGEVQLTAKLTSAKTSYVIEDRRNVLEASAVRAVWARKLWQPRLADDLDPSFHDSCMRESMAAVTGFLDGLHSARWVNDPVRDRAAENKLWQLRLAREVGLQVPRTLLTNNAAQMRSFYAEVNGQMVAKLLTPLSISMDGSAAFVYTSEVTAADLADGEMLRYSPMVFQERVAKTCELRIAFVDGRLFAGAIDAGGSARGQVDWRLAAPHETEWSRDEVPDGLATALKTLMSKLGLIYGAIDLIRTPGGEYIFLEVNPGGEWGMLERDLDYPISAAIADALLR
jgi:MvdC family ATP-grasp ribosomal peptide maturase